MEEMKNLIKRLVAMGRIEEKWAELGDIPVHRRFYWAGRAEARWESIAWLTEVFPEPPYLNTAARATLGRIRRNIAEIQQLTEEFVTNSERYSEIVVKQLRESFKSLRLYCKPTYEGYT
jgi:hypothetical protein